MLPTEDKAWLIQSQYYRSTKYIQFCQKSAYQTDKLEESHTFHFIIKVRLKAMPVNIINIKNIRVPFV